MKNKTNNERFGEAFWTKVKIHSNFIRNGGNTTNLENFLSCSSGYEWQPHWGV